MSVWVSYLHHLIVDSIECSIAAIVERFEFGSLLRYDHTDILSLSLFFSQLPVECGAMSSNSQARIYRECLKNVRRSDVVRSHKISVDGRYPYVPWSSPMSCFFRRWVDPSGQRGSPVGRSETPDCTPQGATARANADEIRHGDDAAKAQRGTQREQAQVSIPSISVSPSGLTYEGGQPLLRLCRAKLANISFQYDVSPPILAERRRRMHVHEGVELPALQAIP